MAFLDDIFFVTMSREVGEVYAVAREVVDPFLHPSTYG